jgi:hypothetical protein
LTLTSMPAQSVYVSPTLTGDLAEHGFDKYTLADLGAGWNGILCKLQRPRPGAGTATRSSASCDLKRELRRARDRTRRPGSVREGAAWFSSAVRTREARGRSLSTRHSPGRDTKQVSRNAP